MAAAREVVPRGVTWLLIAALALADTAEKVPTWRAACEKNDGAACGNLGASYAQAGDFSQAFVFYEKACRFGQPLRCLRAGILAANGKGTAESREKAAELLGLGCKLLDPEDCSAYYAITHGKLVTVDGDVKELKTHPKADPAMLQSVATSLTLACDRGMSNPCGNLGGLYEEGDAVTRDLGKALHFYERACELGDGERCARAARYYANGQGTGVDRGKAEKLFSRSCELLHQVSCALASRAHKGLPIDLALPGVLPDVVKESTPAMRHPPPFSPGGIPAWALETPLDPIPSEGLGADTVALIRSCNHGDARACGNAAAGFMDESGTPVSHAELARRLYQKACSLGRGQRCADLAKFYANGWGTPVSKERERAAKVRACELGMKRNCKAASAPR